MSCNVTAIAAATMLPRSNRATPIASSVFSPQSGIKPKNIPTATPRAIVCGGSLRLVSLPMLVRIHKIGFIREKSVIKKSVIKAVD